jgi:hypothetical protein
MSRSPSVDFHGALQHRLTMSDDQSLVAVRDRREQVIAQLSDAFARDLLEVDEFERRLGLAHRAEAIAELEPLVKDLEAQKDDKPVATVAQTQALVPRVAASSRVREKQLIVAIMGGAVRKGTWTPARRMNVWTVMGGADLDFRDAAFAPGVTEVRVFSLMGGATIVVPPSLAVEMDGIAIMGGFDQSDRAPAHDLDPERPLLRVTGFAMMGGVSIETRLPGESEGDARRRRRRERKERRRQEKLQLSGKDTKLLPRARDD